MSDAPNKSKRWTDTDMPIAPHIKDVKKGIKGTSKNLEAIDDG